MIGLRTDSGDEFLGIRYAQPPVGDLRWRPPQPLPRGHETIKAQAFGDHCPQAASPFGKPSVTEDCLFLNVFTPHRQDGDRRHLPVMVWLHGGGFVAGESDDYDPARLVAQGVVVVTLNFRQGALGFLAQPALDAEGHPAVNYGILDQQAALRWVRTNIAGFGGDPRNVTLFGQSSGGLSVLSNLVSPLATGLFDRAIAESGSYALILPTLAQAEALGTAFAAQAGCADQTAACLRKLSVDQILANQGPGTATTFVDGTILPRSIGAALESGLFNRVPLVNGSNHDEGRLFVATGFDLVSGPLTAAQYPTVIAATFGSLANNVLAEYPLSAFASPDLALAAIETDAIFACNTERADRLASKFTKVFAYEFADENAPEILLPPASFPYGATHASELPFLFDAFAQPGGNAAPSVLNGPEHELAQSMVRYWTDFSGGGDPTGPGLVPWLRFGPSATLQSLVPPQPQLSAETSFAAAHKCAFWDPIIMKQAVPLP
ncbi:MAG TPA: carboxylesterase family protein [Aliidongia sp.]|nr:carboxylesterase family protein [Aliidongia sp.]